MMDGGLVTDLFVYRAITVNRLCEGYGCLPSAAEAELERDPDGLAVFILDVRGYIAAKRAFDGAVDKVDGLKGWIGNPYMTLVQTNTFDARQAALMPPAEGNGR